MCANMEDKEADEEENFVWRRVLTRSRGNPMTVPITPAENPPKDSARALVSNSIDKKEIKCV